MLPVIKRRTFVPSYTNDFFNSDILSTFINDHKYQNAPAVNIRESENNFVIDIAAPGLDKEDFNLKLEEDILTISSEKESKNEIEEDNFMKKEFRLNSFKRSFSIPDSVNQNKIKANHKNGILSLELPKKEEAKPKPAKEIKIS